MFTKHVTVLQIGVSVGPASVGYKLTTEALLFGGSTMTATDIAVASGLCDNVGDKERVKCIPDEVRIGALEEMKRKIETVVDRVKVFSTQGKRKGTPSNFCLTWFSKS